MTDMDSTLNIDIDKRNQIDKLTDIHYFLYQKRQPSRMGL